MNKKHIVLTQVFGLNLKDNQKIIKFSNITLYHFETYKKKLIKLLKVPDYLQESFINTINGYIIVTEIISNNNDEAKQIALKIFYRFELFTNYYIGYKNNFYRISLNPNFNYFNRVFSSNDEKYKETMKRFGIINNYNIDYNIINSNIWNIFDKKNINKFQKKVCTSIEWIGRANYEHDISAKFLYYMISIESLFQQKSGFLSSGIASQIKENVALLLGKNLDDCLNYEKLIDELYSKRSSITHSGSENINENDLKEIKRIAYLLIDLFINKEPYKNIKKYEELICLLNKMKYSRIN